LRIDFGTLPLDDFEFGSLDDTAHFGLTFGKRGREPGATASAPSPSIIGRKGLETPD